MNNSPRATWPLGVENREGNRRELRPRQREEGTVPTLRRRKFNAPTPVPLRSGGLAKPGTLAQDAHGVSGDMGDTSTHLPPKLLQRNGDSGAKPPEGRGQYSHGVARLEQVRDLGHRWRPGSGHRASGRPGHLPQRGAWIRRRRAARQERGSFRAPDLSLNAAGLGHPNRSCSRSRAAGRRRERSGGSGREGGARAAGI